MPDEMLMVLATAFAAGVAAVVLVVLGWPGRLALPVRLALGGALGVAGAFFLGARQLGTSLEWPPAEDQHRFLLILLPATIVIASLAALLDRRPWAAWLLRLLLAAAAARILLHGAVYLKDTPGAETHRWTPSQTLYILGGLATVLLGVWAALDRLGRRRGGIAAKAALAVTCAGAAATVMFSGYLSGGQLGLPLAGALGGVAVASWPLSKWARETASVAVGVVGLFGLLVIGYFFGSLTPFHAVLLFLAPLLCWVLELPLFRSLWPWARGVLGVVLVAVPVVLAVTQARRQALAENGSPASPGYESREDYSDYERSLAPNP